MLASFNGLRGLFALEIILGHSAENIYGQAIFFGAPLPMRMLAEFLLISVSYFFFVSAWGLAASAQRDPEYLRGFVLRKCGYLLSIMLVYFWENELLRVLLGRHTGYTQGFFSYFYGNVNWYLWELMLFYILFWAAYRFDRAHAVLICTVFVVAAVTASYFFNVPKTYYISAATFPLGLAFQRYFDKIQSFLLSPKGCAALLVLLMLGMSGLFFEEGLVAAVYIRNILCVSSMLLLSDILAWFQFGNKALRLLERYSTEIYLYQFLSFKIAPMNHGRVIYILTAIVATMVQAVLMAPVDRALHRFWEQHFRVR